MGVYIKGMEMPTEGFVEILIRDDGTVQQTGQSNRFNGMDYYTPYIGETPAIYKAIPVPPHGDLIDRDAAKGSIKPWSPEDERNGCTFDTVKKLMHTMLDRTPTIIPAEDGE